MSSGKLLSFLILGIFLLSFVSAIELNPFANVKSYDLDIDKADLSDFIKQDFNSKYGVIKFSKTIFWIPTDKVAEYSLTKVEDSVINAYAEGKAVLYFSGKLFDDINFKDVKGNLKELRDVQYYIWVNESYQIEVPEYKEECSIIESKNGTIEDCNNIKIGSHNATRYKEYWKPYNFETLDAGNYIWKLEAKKERPNQAIDFIPTAQGKQLDEWAWWNTNFPYKRPIPITEKSGTTLTNYSVLIYVPYDSDMQADFDDLRFVNSTENGELGYWIENKTDSNYAYVWVKVPTLTASSNTTIYMYYGNAGVSTTSNMKNAFLLGDDFLGSSLDTSLWTSSGTISIINSELTLVSSGSISSINKFGNKITVTGKIKFVNTTVSGSGILVLFDGTTKYVRWLIDTSPSYLQVDGQDTSRQIITTDIPSTTTDYKKYRIDRISGSNVSFYNNGIFKANITDPIYIPDESVNLSVQMAQYSAKQIVYDWIMVNPYASTAPTYTIGSEQAYQSLGVTLLSPTNNTNFTTNNINFSANVTSIGSVPLSIENVSLVINGVINETNSSGIEGVYNFSKTLADGNYNWTIIAYGNNSVQYNATETRDLVIDTTPAINIQSPEMNKNYSVSNIYVNATSSLPVDLWYLDYNGTNYTITINETFTFLDGNNYNLKLWGRNAITGIWGLNNSIIFSVDATPPTIEITSPNETFDYMYEDYNLTLNTTITDINGLDTCWYEYNGTNKTFSCSSGVLYTDYFNYTKDKNNLTVWANDTFGNLNSSVVDWSYKIFENGRWLNSSTYETATESYIISLSSNSSLTNVYLNYSNNSIPTTSSSGNWTYSRDAPIGTLGNQTINWIATYSGENISIPIYSYQNVLETVFTICNATYTNDALNLTFKDEANLNYINATVPTSTWTYYLGSGAVNKTYTYSSTTEQMNYLFCSSVDRNLNVNPYVQFKKGIDYPQRIWEPSTKQYNQSVIEQTLYLLSSTDGIYVTYQVLDGIGNQLEGVSVTSTRTINGESFIVGIGETDAAGSITFWMNPDFIHEVVFSKSGYETYTLNQFPTQSTYTVTLGKSFGADVTDYTRGITYEINPSFGQTLNVSKLYNFNMTFNSSYWELDSFGFTIYGDGSVIGANSSTNDTGGFIYNILNISDYNHIAMKIYWVVNGTTTYGKNNGWFTFNYEEGTDWSIWTFFQDLSTYADTDGGNGIFGLNQNSLNLIIFIIIFLVTGLVSYKFSITSPPAVWGIIFAMIFLFDVGLGLIQFDVFGGVQYFPTIFALIVMVALIIKEGTQ